MTALDVLVTCRPHRGAPELSLYPQVRGHYLAKHLRRSGLNAEFLPLPLPGAECKVLIWSEYDHPLAYFREHFEAKLRQVRAERMFCMTAISAPPGYFSVDTGRWFANEGKGGVLCHLVVWKPRSWERAIGVGVDLDVLPPFSAARDSVIFDFPYAKQMASWEASRFDPAILQVVRRRMPEVKLVASGPPEFPFREHFDLWWEYGRTHTEFVHMYGTAFAFVVGWRETMGMSIAEAQVCGASIVSDENEIHPHMAVSRFGYRRGDGAELAEALAKARDVGPDVVAEAARKRFDFEEVVRLTRAAIGL